MGIPQILCDCLLQIPRKTNIRHREAVSGVLDGRKGPCQLGATAGDESPARARRGGCGLGHRRVIPEIGRLESTHWWAPSPFFLGLATLLGWSLRVRGKHKKQGLHSANGRANLECEPHFRVLFFGGKPRGNQLQYFQKCKSQIRNTNLRQWFSTRSTHQSRMKAT